MTFNSSLVLFISSPYFSLCILIAFAPDFPTKHYIFSIIPLEHPCLLNFLLGLLMSPIPWLLFVFLVSVVTPGCVFTSNDLKVGFTNKKEHSLLPLWLWVTLFLQWITDNENAEHTHSKICFYSKENRNHKMWG